MTNLPNPRPDAFAPSDDQHHGGKTYCVPFALAYILGCSYTTAEELVRLERNEHHDAAITGVSHRFWGPILLEYANATLHACDRKEWVAEFPDHNEFVNLGPTIAKWDRELPDDHRDQLKLVRMNRHVILVRGEQYLDNDTKTWLPLAEFPSRRSRVDFYYLIPNQD